MQYLNVTKSTNGTFGITQNLMYLYEYMHNVMRCYATNSVTSSLCYITHLYFRRWSVTSYAERATILERIASNIEQRLDEFAEAESRDQGKPLSLAKTVDIPRAVHNFRFFAGASRYQMDR